MINTKAMEGEAQENRITRAEQENPRTVRRHPVLGLREELADRAQQGIVRHAAWDCCRFGDGRSPARVLLGGASNGCHCRIYGSLPAVRYSKGKLSNNSEQTK